MKPRLIFHLVVSLLVFSGATGLQAQTNAAPASEPAVSDHAVPASVMNKLAELLAEKDLFAGKTNALLVDIFGAKGTNHGVLEFLKDLHLRPKVFKATGGGSNDTSLGFEFDYDKPLTHYALNEKSLNPVGISLSLHAKGEVAFASDDNPNNLIEAGGSIHLFQGLGGVTPQKANNEEAANLLLRQMKEEADSGGTVSDSLAMEFTEVMRPQFLYDLQARGGIETDQRFDDRQYVFGAQVGFVLREWRQDSGFSKVNVFDYPFAVIRKALQQEDGFRPSGRTFPSVVLGLDQVDPSENDTRLAVDPDEDPYARVRVEVAFKTHVLKWRDDWLYVSAAYRHFQELGASQAIKAAHLDRANYFVMVLDLPYNFNISYSTGKLPLDQKNDDVFALGWKLNL